MHFIFLNCSVSLEGKERAVKIGTVDRLVDLLDSNNNALKSKAALALSMYVKFFSEDSNGFFSVFHFSISIITPGKYCTIKAGAIPKLLAMLNNESSELVVNALKVYLSR